MNSKILFVPAVVSMAVATVSASAQQSAEEGAKQAAEAARIAAEAAADKAEAAKQGNLENPPPAPPALYIPPPAPPSAPLPPGDYSSPPRLVSFQALDARPTDYPVEAWNADEEGVVRFELSVSDEGKPTDCTILESSGSTSLDTRTCEIAMERAEFEPALDNDGNPVSGKHRDLQTWSKREPQFGANTVVDVSFTVTEDGTVLNCEVNEISGEISEQMRNSFEREPCPGMNRSPRSVYRDENGIPVAKQVRLKVLVDVTDPPSPE